MAQQNNLVWGTNKLSQLPSWENPSGFVVNPSALMRIKCPSTFCRGKGSAHEHAGRYISNFSKTKLASPDVWASLWCTAVEWSVCLMWNVRRMWNQLEENIRTSAQFLRNASRPTCSAPHFTDCPFLSLFFILTFYALNLFFILPYFIQYAP